MDDKTSWQRFQRLRVNKKTLTKRARKVETATTKHAHKFVLKKMNSIREARQKITGWLLLIGVLIAAITVQMVWFQSSYHLTAAAPGGTYSEAMLGPIDTLNPLYARTNAELSASRLMFSSLYDYDESGHLRGDLATSIVASTDNKQYTVTLRDDARWHDDDKVTAADVVFTVNLMKDPSARATLQLSWEGIDAVAVDEHTVQFTLPSQLAVFEEALTFPVLPRHVLEFVEPGTLRESNFSLSPIGSGPFKLSYYQANGPNEHKIVHMSAWEKYYRGSPKVSRFEIHAYETPDAIEKAVKAREVNAALDINQTDVRSLKGFSTKTYSVNSGVYALINTQSPVLQDRAVRQALQRGTDTSAVRSTLDIDVDALDYPILPYQIDNINLTKKPSYDRVAAESMLTKAGWKKAADGVRKKGKVPLVITIVAPKDVQYEAVVSSLTNQWKAMGINVSTMIFDPKATDQSFAQAVLQPRAYDVLINELAIGADPDVYAYWHSSQRGPLGRNFSSYKSDIVDDALFSARLRSETSLRAEKYRTFVGTWMRDVPAIGLYQSAFEYARTVNVDSLPDNAVLPTTADRYSNVIFWTSERQQVYKTP